MAKKSKISQWAEATRKHFIKQHKIKEKWRKDNPPIAEYTTEVDGFETIIGVWSGAGGVYFAYRCGKKSEFSPEQLIEVPKEVQEFIKANG